MRTGNRAASVSAVNQFQVHDVVAIRDEIVEDRHQEALSGFGLREGEGSCDRLIMHAETRQSFQIGRAHV